MADEGELDTVKLISADGHEFVVDRKAAMVSGTIKSMLSGPGRSTSLTPNLGGFERWNDAFVNP
jgi:hypothetical protein